MSDYPNLLKSLREKNYAPVYFLQGEETYYIDSIVSYIEKNVLEESQRGFNQLVLYGKDTSLTDIIGTARRYPMMSERQVVIVKEAQDLKDWNRDDRQTLVINYLEKPLASTLLVFAHKHKTLDKRTKIGKALDKHAVCFTAKKPYDDKIPEWIRSHCAASQMTIDEPAVMMLSENIGNNLQRLANEIEKLSLHAGEKKRITREMIEKYVGISKDYNVFELQKALSAVDRTKALKIVRYFAANAKNNPLVLIIYHLFSYYTKLLMIHQSPDKSDRAIASLIGVNPFFVKEYLQAARNYPVQKVAQNIQHLHTADLQSKGIGYAPMKEAPVLTELIYKLMH